MSRILIVEDEPTLLDTLALNLVCEGYEAVKAKDGSTALELLQSQHFDLILLDLMLPGMSGLELCTAIRLEHKDMPVLMLTARDTPEDRIEGLRTGADDYLTKPFRLEELLLRIQNLLRRRPGDATSTGTREEYTFGENTIHFTAYEAHTRQGVVPITKKECALLQLLIDRSHEVVSRQQILQIVWGYDVYPSTRTIDNFILQFRKVFEPDPRAPVYFHSIRGVGYKFTPPPENG